MREKLTEVYRPFRLSDIVGQRDTVKLLRPGFENREPASFYLLHGLHGSGKTTTARMLSLYMNCTKMKPGKGAEPCLKCKSCNLFHTPSITLVILNNNICISCNCYL